ncbi:hypothetical protein ACLK1S_27140 [Escherichia coli]
MGYCATQIKTLTNGCSSLFVLQVELEDDYSTCWIISTRQIQFDRLVIECTAWPIPARSFRSSPDEILCQRPAPRRDCAGGRGYMPMSRSTSSPSPSHKWATPTVSAD